jgi:uncharacterized membrane protein
MSAQRATLPQQNGQILKRRLGNLKRKIGIALCVLGVILVILGVVWMTAIFPSMVKMPCEMDTIVRLGGSVTLGNPLTMSSTTFDNVVATREYGSWKDCTGSITYLSENVTWDIPIPQIASQISSFEEYALDRKTMKLVADSDSDWNGDYEAYFGQPINFDKDEEYPIFNTGQPMDEEGTIVLKYTGKDVIDGLDVQIWEASTPAEGLSYTEEPGKKIYTTVKLWAEPASGIGVYTEATRTITVGGFTVYEDHLQFTDETVDEMVKDAKDAKQMLNMMKTVLPWTMIVLGIVLVLLGIFLARRSGKGTPKPEAPEPSKS